MEEKPARRRLGVNAVGKASKVNPAIKDWEDLLEAVKKWKVAGIIPIAVGGLSARWA